MKRLILVVLCLVVFVAGASAAVIPGIQHNAKFGPFCISTQNGIIRGVKTEQPCKKKEVRIKHIIDLTALANLLKGLQDQIDALKIKAGTPGPAGPQGAQGPAGANGTNGSNGAQGAKGDTGAVGAAGATVTVTSPSVTTTTTVMTTTTVTVPGGTGCTSNCGGNNTGGNPDCTMNCGGSNPDGKL